MWYRPRHAFSRLGSRTYAGLRTRRARVVIVLGAAVAASAAGLAAAGASGAATAAYTTGPHNISMGGQFAGLCLDDFKQNVTSGAPVVLWTCSSTDSAQQWYMAGDRTIRLGSPTTGPALDLVSGKVVLGPPSDANTRWQPLGDWGLVNLGQSAPGTGSDGPTLWQLNDPGYATANGTQLISFKRTPGNPTANAQFNMPGTSYAQTAYTSRPDGGVAGDNWALDSATRFASITALGSGNYEGSVADDYGTFLTVPGNTAPNGSGTIANVVKGTFNGTGGYTFTAAGGSPSASHVPGTAFGGPSPAGDPGDGASTGNWYQLFFPAGTTYGGPGFDGGGPMGWAWTYSACGGSPTASTWADTAANGSGSGSADGNITGGC